MQALDASGTLARFTPIPESEADRNLRKLQEVREVATRGTPATVAELHARLRRRLDGDPTAVPVPAGIHTIAESREAPTDEPGTAAARAVAVRKLQEARR